MLLKKTDLPQEDELVLCTVTKVFHHGVFADMDEYGRSGMIHISEVSPGRIRNIRDYVKEGKKVVCKILKVDMEKGHIDLSLRRVNEGQKKIKINQIKQEQKAEKIIEFTARNLKKDNKKLYGEIAPSILEQYEYVHQLFDDVVRDNAKLSDFVKDKKLADTLTELIRERMKPPEVFIQGELKLQSYDSDGLDIIKQAIKKGKDLAITYEGGGAYHVKAKAAEYKEAEKIIDTSIKSILKFIESKGGQGNFSRAE